MNKEHALATLLRIGKETVPELGDDATDSNKTYRDLGINSLDLMQILAAAMKEMKTKIPSDQLSGVATLNGLADLFVKFSA